MKTRWTGGAGAIPGGAPSGEHAASWAEAPRGARPRPGPRGSERSCRRTPPRAPAPAASPPAPLERGRWPGPNDRPPRRHPGGHPAPHPTGPEPPWAHGTARWSGATARRCPSIPAHPAPPPPRRGTLPPRACPHPPRPARGSSGDAVAVEARHTEPRPSGGRSRWTAGRRRARSRRTAGAHGHARPAPSPAGGRRSARPRHRRRRRRSYRLYIMYGRGTTGWGFSASRAPIRGHSGPAATEDRYNWYKLAGPRKSGLLGAGVRAGSAPRGQGSRHLGWNRRDGGSVFLHASGCEASRA